MFYLDQHHRNLYGTIVVDLNLAMQLALPWVGGADTREQLGLCNRLDDANFPFVEGSTINF